MLSLTKKTDYALVAVACLAKPNQGIMSAREIAGCTRVPQSILTNILKTLTSSGLVNSVRGANGGYVLARPVNDISLRELIVAIEGPIRFVQCALQTPESTKSPCELESTCPVRVPALRVHDRLDSFLEQVSLAEIVEDHESRPGVQAIQLESALGKAGATTELTL